jgi:prepilin-type N-terminal cleavage/methylation domain-containing protein
MTARAPRNRHGGFTLVELMMVVFIISVLSALIGTAYMRNVKKSRTAEASGHLQKMWVGAVAYYETDHALANGRMAPKAFPGDCASFFNAEPMCCDQPNEVCSGNDPVYLGEPWKSIQFSISSPHLYVPHFGACPEDNKHIWLEVWGDLNCDRVKFSKFTRLASVSPGGDVQGYLTPAIIDETE